MDSGGPPRICSARARSRRTSQARRQTTTHTSSCSPTPQLQVVRQRSVRATSHQVRREATFGRRPSSSACVVARRCPSEASPAFTHLGVGPRSPEDKQTQDDRTRPTVGACATILRRWRLLCSSRQHEVAVLVEAARGHHERQLRSSSGSRPRRSSRTDET